MVDDVAREFADKGLIVLAIDVLEPDQKVKKYLTDHLRSPRCTTHRAIRSTQ
jgi:dienelactone hydrolase